MNIPLMAWIAIASIGVTVSIFISQLIFKTGHLTARVEALEKWRGSMRDDMHEVSDKIDGLKTDVQKLATLIEERTDRRVHQRHQI